MFLGIQRLNLVSLVRRGERRRRLADWSVAIRSGSIFALAALAPLLYIFVAKADAALTNIPPSVAIVFPPNDIYVTYVSLVDLRASAADPDGSIRQVRFFVGTNLLGSSSAPPYTNQFLAQAGVYTLTAVATDNLGLSSTSAPVRVIAEQTPWGFPRFLILSPKDGAAVAAPASFAIEAYMYATDGREHAVDFFIGTNQLGTVTDPPYSLVVTNLLEGEYELHVHAHTNQAFHPRFAPRSLNPIQIRVASLVLGTVEVVAGTAQFNVAGRITGKTNLIEASTNLLTWQSIATNVPTTSSFLFLDPAATNFNRRFYRALVNP